MPGHPNFRLPISFRTSHYRTSTFSPRTATQSIHRASRVYSGMFGRPARLLHHSQPLRRSVATAQQVLPSTSVDVDESYIPFIHDVRSGVSRRKRNGSHADFEPSNGNHVTAEAGPSRLGRVIEEATTEHDPRYEEDHPRLERRSPATVLGSKRIGVVVLPDRLVANVQREIRGQLEWMKSALPC